MFSMFVGQLKVGIGRTITAPTDITIVPVAASNASGTTKQTITATHETGLWAPRGAGPELPVEAALRFLRELEIWLTLLPAARAQVDQRGLRLEEAEDPRPAGWASTAPTAGARVALKPQSLGTSLAPGSPLRWPAWSTGIFTGRTGAGEGSARTATATADLRTPRTREIPRRRDWRVRPPALRAPTAGQAPAAAPPAQIPSAVPAAAPAAGERSSFGLLQVLEFAFCRQAEWSRKHTRNNVIPDYLRFMESLQWGGSLVLIWEWVKNKLPMWCAGSKSMSVQGSQFHY